MNSLHSIGCKNLDKARETNKDLELKINSILSNIININIENSILTDELAIKTKDLQEIQQTYGIMAIKNESLSSKSSLMEFRYEEELAGKLDAMANMKQLQELVSHF